MVTDLETLKEHYKLEFDIKQTLENKANNMTTISGSVTALLFGFGQLFISILIAKNYQWFPFINSFLLVGSLAGLIAIVLSLLGFRIQDYSYVIGKVVVSRPSLANLPNFQAEANNDPASVTSYQNCIKENEKKNNSKSKYIEAAQWAFSVSIGMIAFIVGWLVVAPIPFR